PERSIFNLMGLDGKDSIYRNTSTAMQHWRLWLRCGRIFIAAALNPHKTKAVENQPIQAISNKIKCQPTGWHFI
ncbi:MAG: hypothetical protein Q4D78_03775, partial [Neisseria zoodegmatis]|uniref:hypothetical protein n=1 Tax=Neisseria zoodegmatis TaxID=326523 RepID=UPI0026F367CC